MDSGIYYDTNYTFLRLRMTQNYNERLYLVIYIYIPIVYFLGLFLSSAHERMRCHFHSILTDIPSNIIICE